MDKTTLVDSDLKAGRRVVEELERRGIKIDVAAWLQDEESYEWRLLVASPGGDETGSGPIYEAIQKLLREENIRDLDLGNFLVASPHERIVRDLRQHVGTDHGFYENEVWLGPIGLAGRGYRLVRIYRAVGDAIGNDARVRIKATGQLGTVRGVIETPREPRYLVLYDMNRDDVRPLREGEPPTEAGRDFGEQDLEFLYVIRTGGWPEKLPDWLLAATGADKIQRAS